MRRNDVNKSSYVHKDRFKLRQVLVSGGDAEQKGSRATKPETLGTAFLQKAGYSQRSPICGASTHGVLWSYTHNNLFSGEVSL